MIPISHITFIHINIAITIINGLNHSALFIIIGTIHHSICCTIMNNIHIHKNPISQYDNIQTNKAGNAHKNGHKYGINSINQAIRDSVNLLSMFIQKIANVRSHA